MSVVEQSIEARPYTGLNWSMARCKLCWRIGISIFIAIFFVEAVVLIFSAARFERDRLAEIEGSGLAWITTIIRVHDNVMDKAAVDAASRELPQLSKILGLTLYDVRGYKIGSFGDIPSLRLHQGGAERPIQQGPERRSPPISGGLAPGPDRRAV